MAAATGPFTDALPASVSAKEHTQTLLWPAALSFLIGLVCAFVRRRYSCEQHKPRVSANVSWVGPLTTSVLLTAKPIASCCFMLGAMSAFISHPSHRREGSSTGSLFSTHHCDQSTEEPSWKALFRRVGSIIVSSLNQKFGLLLHSLRWLLRLILWRLASAAQPVAEARATQAEVPTHLERRMVCSAVNELGGSGTASVSVTRRRSEKLELERAIRCARRKHRLEMEAAARSRRRALMASLPAAAKSSLSGDMPAWGSPKCDTPADSHEPVARQRLASSGSEEDRSSQLPNDLAHRDCTSLDDY